MNNIFVAENERAPILFPSNSEMGAGGGGEVLALGPRIYIMTEGGHRRRREYEEKTRSVRRVTWTFLTHLGPGCSHSPA